jgi:hypothetical protein
MILCTHSGFTSVTYILCHLVRKVLTRLQAELSLQTPAHAGSSLADFSILKMEATCSSKMSVHTRSTRRHIPEDGILQRYKYFVIISHTVSPFPQKSHLLPVQNLRVQRGSAINLLLLSFSVDVTQP